MDDICIIMLNYLSQKDIAMLRVASKSVNTIYDIWAPTPEHVGQCLLCPNTTSWMFHGLPTPKYCCTTCVYKYADDIKELGYPIHLIKKYIDCRNTAIKNANYANHNSVA